MLTEFCKLRLFDPETIMTDFEQAIMNAFRSLFPSVSQSGCFYHFSQWIYRQVQQRGLQNDYVAEDFFTFIRMLAAIAFIPITNAVETFDTVVDAGYPDRTEPVVNYSKDNFIGRPDRRGNRRNPAFPLTLWNVYQRVFESLPRTNNSVGGWHCGFLTMLTSCSTNWYGKTNYTDLLLLNCWLDKYIQLNMCTALQMRENVNVVADYNNSTFADFWKALHITYSCNELSTVLL